MKSKHYFYAICLSLVIACISLWSIYITHKRKTTHEAGYVMSIDKGSDKSLDRIGSFDLKIRDGQLTSIPVVPTGWTINIRDEASADTEVTGQVYVDACDLSLDELENTLIVNKRAYNYGVPLAVSLTVYTTTEDSPGKHVFRNVKLVKN